MESWTDFCSRSLINKIVHYLTGSAHENFSVIKVNSENLAINGELHFINSFNTWKSFVVCDRNCATILQHFIHAYDSKRDHTDADVSEEVFKQLISKSNDWSVRIQHCSLQKEKVCLYLNRADVIPNVVKIAIKCNKTFGKVIANNKVFDLRYQSDAQSNLTTQRLLLMRNITAKVLNLHGYRVSNEDCVGKYIFTTRSEGLIEEGYKKYVCGVVKNLQSNTKEIHLTWEQCIKDRMDYIDNNFQSMFHNFEENEHNTEKYVILHNMAHAIMIFELMSVKPSRSIVIENDNFKSDRHITNTRGALFVLYNTARIAKIIAEYNLKVSCGDFPLLPNIDDVDFSQLHQEVKDCSKLSKIAILYIQNMKSYIPKCYRTA
ncbi:uncharacterized protein LOC116847743 isoform X2 [Odontomachus brunneus]|uniref:uncharacterized protein LOC116847743 isoform X2 n=1 Tax=Odontomachus brunneus TaxID=486640 RepID=UPI0013F1A837|nr:uncharacterized protein LOC116847743 isoform X2 [Odontomachus brunneus]